MAKGTGLEVGTIVENPKAPDWGLGKILALTQPYVDVRFLNRATTVKVDASYLRRAEDQADPFPKVVPKVRKTKAKAKA